ncbi:MAG TPA: GtrA family protein [Patescibacteria group bacterium]|jgi:putative flippase GtrA|nr:GtrA family protein [Patescibacteria group bacterium]
MAEAETRRPLFTKFLRTLIAGAASAAVLAESFIILNDTLPVASPYIKPRLANLLAFIAATIVNYLLSRLWVFDRGSTRLHHQIVQFFIVAVIGLVGEFTIFNIILLNTQQAFISTVVAMGMMFFVNFYLKQRLFDHKERRRRLKKLHSLYAILPWHSRLHMFIRWHSCPIEAADTYLPKSGKLLEIGSGRGLVSIWAAILRPNLDVHGVDIDVRKIIDAQAVAESWENSKQKITFSRVSPNGSLPPGPWQAIEIFDTIYLLKYQDQLDLLEKSAKILAKDGVLILKHMNDRPLWKVRFMSLQEKISVKVIGLTVGVYPFTFLSPKQITDHLQTLGLQTKIIPIDKGYPYPHLLIVARKS